MEKIAIIIIVVHDDKVTGSALLCNDTQCTSYIRRHRTLHRAGIVLFLVFFSSSGQTTFAVARRDPVNYFCKTSRITRVLGVSWNMSVYNIRIVNNNVWLRDDASKVRYPFCYCVPSTWPKPSERRSVEFLDDDENPKMFNKKDQENLIFKKIASSFRSTHDVYYLCYPIDER